MAQISTAHSTSAPAPFPTEKTFSAYNKGQGEVYAQARRDYHPKVYKAIIDHHTSTGGQLNTLIDVGCGPGMAARALAPKFAHAIGLDPSEGMIATARSLNSGAATLTSEPIRFEVSTAEMLGANLSLPIPDASIDLITASNAAHWFDMNGFWPAAARVLVPGGSVALWTSGKVQIDPSVPNAMAIQAAVDENREQNLMAYITPGNLMASARYTTLPLPWTLASPVPDFDEATFFRKDWDGTEEFHLGEPYVDMDTFEKMLGTGSPITRWREAHPEDVGTERDVVRMLRRKIEQLLHEAGVKAGEERLRGLVQGSLLIVKKKKTA